MFLLFIFFITQSPEDLFGDVFDFHCPLNSTTINAFDNVLMLSNSREKKYIQSRAKWRMRPEYQRNKRPEREQESERERNGGVNKLL